MEDLISQYFTETSKGTTEEKNKNEMKLLGVKGIGSALNRFIDKEDKDSISCIVDKQFEKLVNMLMSIDDIDDEQVDDQLSSFKRQREKSNGGNAAACKMEEDEAEAALNAPNRQMQLDNSPSNSANHGDISDENIPPAVQPVRGGKGRGRGSRGQPRGRVKIATSNARGKSKSVIPDSDEEVDNVP